jgi:hypothetical protein
MAEQSVVAHIGIPPDFCDLLNLEYLGRDVLLDLSCYVQIRLRLKLDVCALRFSLVSRCSITR